MIEFLILGRVLVKQMNKGIVVKVRNVIGIEKKDFLNLVFKQFEC